MHSSGPEPASPKAMRHLEEYKYSIDTFPCCISSLAQFGSRELCSTGDAQHVFSWTLHRITYIVRDTAIHLITVEFSH